MCRLLVVRGEIAIREVIAAALAMSSGSTAGHERTEEDGRPWNHLDGWGMVVRTAGGEWHCARGGDALTPAAAGEFAPADRTSLAIAHLRKASDPQYLGPAFAHPVEMPRDGRPCYFFHNGWAPEVGALIGRPEGWDSERLLEYLLPTLGSRLGADDTPLRDRLEALPDSTTAANFIFVEGDEVTVANWYPLDTPYPGYYAYRYAVGAERVLISSDALPQLANGARITQARNRTIVRFTSETPAEEVRAQLEGGR